MRPPALDGEHIAGAVGRVRPRYVVIMELIARHHVPRGASRGEFTNGLGRVLVLRGGHEPQQSAGQILIAQRVRTAGSKSASDRARIRVPGLRDRIARPFAPCGQQTGFRRPAVT